MFSKLHTFWLIFQLSHSALGKYYFVVLPLPCVLASFFALALCLILSLSLWKEDLHWKHRLTKSGSQFFTELNMPFTSQSKMKKGGEKSHRCHMCASSFTAASKQNKPCCIFVKGMSGHVSSSFRLNLSKPLSQRWQVSWVALFLL